MSFDGGVFDNSADMDAAINTVAGASGSFTVTWTTSTNAIDASAWQFADGSNTEITDYNSGWGVRNSGDTTIGAGQFQLGEVFLLSFDTSNLTLEKGKALVFSLDSRDTGDQFTIYKRTGVNSGLNILEETTTANTFSTDVLAGSNGEFGIVMTSSFNLINGFRIDVIDDESPLAPIQHLDARIANSVITSGTEVMQWVDQSANGNDAIPAVGSVLFSEGDELLDVGATANSLELFSASDSESILDFTGAASGNNGFAVLIAFKISTLNTTWMDVLGNSTTVNTGFLFRLGRDGKMKTWLGTAKMDAAGRVANGDTVVLAANYNATTGVYEFWNSTDNASVSTTVAAANFALPKALTIGSTAGNSRFLNGKIGEVKVFNQALSEEDFANETATMVDNWIAPDTTGLPNIVLFYVDDWAWSATPVRMDADVPNSGMEGLLEMPNLEQMAANGMRFSNAYGSPQCSPARAALHTGQTNPRNGLTVYLNNDSEYVTAYGYANFPVISNGTDKTLDPDAVTIPEAMAMLGYESALYGKWHTRGNPEDEYGVGNAPTPPAGINGSNEANNPGNTIEGNYLDGITDPKLMEWITSRGLNFMEETVAKDKPFCLVLSHYAMHEGRECFPSSRARYQNIPEVVAFNEGITDPALLNRRKDPAVWLGMAYEFDQTIAQVYDKLEELGVKDNTYVLIVSDNGYRLDFFDEVTGMIQPLHAHKWMAWEAGIRVPMIVNGPGIPANTICTDNVANYDILPTFFEWGGGDPTVLENLDGISLASMMEGEEPTAEFSNRSLFFHYPHYRDNLPHSAMIKGDEKIVYFYETPVTHPTWEPIMYFNINHDLGEYSNTYPDNVARANELHGMMTNYLQNVGARIPLVPNPDYDPVIYQADKFTPYRELRGPFIGTRIPEEDEIPAALDAFVGR